MLLVSYGLRGVVVARSSSRQIPLAIRTGPRSCTQRHRPRRAGRLSVCRGACTGALHASGAVRPDDPWATLLLAQGLTRLCCDLFMCVRGDSCVASQSLRITRGANYCFGEVPELDDILAAAEEGAPAAADVDQKQARLRACATPLLDNRVDDLQVPPWLFKVHLRLSTALLCLWLLTDCCGCAAGLLPLLLQASDRRS